MSDKKIDYTALEQELIDRAKQWRKSPEFRSTPLWDNTPFYQDGYGMKMRAIVNENKNKWQFHVCVRIGYTGALRDRLDEAITQSMKEKMDHLERLHKQHVENNS